MKLYRPKILRGGMRRDKRQACHWPAILHTRPMNLSCLVLDFSVGGCKIRANTALIDRSADVIIDIPTQGLRLDGKIVWMRGDEAGINFRLSELSKVIETIGD